MKKFKINLVDIAVLILLIAVAITIKMRFQKFNRKDDFASQMKTIQYTMRFENVRDFTANAFEIGDSVFDKQTGVEIGKIIDKQREDNISLVGLIDGTITKSPVPEKNNVILSIETNAIVNDDGYFANNTIEMKVGSEKVIETKYAKSEGKIIAIKICEK